MNRPTLADVLEARKTIAPYVSPTPLISYPALDNYIGAEIRLKHENHHPLGAFKVRGGINLLAHMDPEQRRCGLITASTGNHGQSVANACRIFGAKAVIVVPEGANPLKVRSMRNLGAQVSSTEQTSTRPGSTASGCPRRRDTDTSTPPTSRYWWRVWPPTLWRFWRNFRM